MPKKKKPQTDGQLRAVLVDLPEGYSHFFFSSELHYNDWARRKFYHVRVLLKPYHQGKIHYEGGNGYAKAIVDFHREILQYSHISGADSTMSSFFR